MSATGKSPEIFIHAAFRASFVELENAAGESAGCAYEPSYRRTVMANERDVRDQEASSRGFAAMDEEKPREIASKGGHSQGKENNPGNFANDRQKASEAGRKGGQN